MYNTGMGKPKQVVYHKNVISTLLPDGYKEAISRRAEQEGLRPSDIIRRALKLYLFNIKEKKQNGN